MSDVQILFLDESGPPEPKRKADHRWFVLAGVILPEAQWKPAEIALRGLLAKYGVQGEICWKWLNYKSKDKRSTCRHLSPAQLNTLRNDLVATISALDRTTLLAVVTDLHAAFDDSTLGTAESIYHRAYKTITERFQYRLQEIGATEPGIVVCDVRSKSQNKELKKLHDDLVRSDKPFTSEYDRIVEGLFLQDSHHSVGIQLADIVAGSVMNGLIGHPEYFNALYAKFRKDPCGDAAGWGVPLVPHSNASLPINLRQGTRLYHLTT